MNIALYASCALGLLQITRRLHFERTRSRLADNLLLTRAGFAKPLARIRGCVDHVLDVPMLALTPRLQASAGVMPLLLLVMLQLVFWQRSC